MSQDNSATATAEAPTAPADAQATPTPVAMEVAPTEAPALTPEQDANRKAMEAQLALQQIVKSKEDDCAGEIAKVCEKYGCELIVGHSVKVRFRQQGQPQ